MKSTYARNLICISLTLVILAGCQADAVSITPPPRPVSTTIESTPTLTVSAPTVTLALFGDVMLGRSVHPSAETFAYLQPFLKSADLTLANLESPLTNSAAQTTSPYVLCAPPENVKYLAEAGFDLLSLANNHRFDCGETGLEETQSTLVKAGLGFIGNDSGPVYREFNEIRLAFLAFDATDEFHIETATQAVRSAQKTRAIVIVSIHWGAEYQSGVSSDQKQIAAQLAEAGAVLIWGHHPHVLQPAEWLNARKTLVLYSLGNALFDQQGLENTRQSALALVTLNTSGIEKLDAIPFLIDSSHSRIVEPNPVSAETIWGFFKRVTEKPAR